MKKYALKFFYFLILAVFVASGANVFSQNEFPAQKAKERIMLMKKMKMLEVLNLSEEKAEKFLAKYTPLEKKVFEKHKEFNHEVARLQDFLKSGKDGELKKQTDKVVQIQEELNAALIDKLKSMRSILSDEEYAKYLIFEKRFQEDLRKAVMDKDRDARPQNDRDEPRRR